GFIRPQRRARTKGRCRFEASTKPKRAIQKEGRMTPPKPLPPKASGSTKTADRKPWKKKTPVEVVLEQTDKLKTQIVEKEEELKDLRSQLQKFEQARKIFETD